MLKVSLGICHDPGPHIFCPVKVSFTHRPHAVPLLCDTANIHLAIRGEVRENPMFSFTKGNLFPTHLGSILDNTTRHNASIYVVLYESS